MCKISQTKYRTAKFLKWLFFKNGTTRNMSRLKISIFNSYHKTLIKRTFFVTCLLKIFRWHQLCIIRWKCPDEQWAVFCRGTQSLRKFLGFRSVLPTDHSPSPRGISRFSSARLELSKIFTKSSFGIVKL